MNICTRLENNYIREEDKLQFKRRIRAELKPKFGFHDEKRLKDPTEARINIIRDPLKRLASELFETFKIGSIDSDFYLPN